MHVFVCHDSYLTIPNTTVSIYLLNHSYGPNSMVVAITLFFTVVNVAFVFIEWFVFQPILEYVALFYGVFIGWHAVSLFACLCVFCKFRRSIYIQ